MIGPERLREIEPHAAGLQALAVASTGIIDYVGVAERYAAIVRERGGEIRTGARVLALRRDGERLGGRDHGRQRAHAAT